MWPDVWNAVLSSWYAATAGFSQATPLSSGASGSLGAVYHEDRAPGALADSSHDDCDGEAPSSSSLECAVNGLV